MHRTYSKRSDSRFPATTFRALACALLMFGFLASAAFAEDWPKFGKDLANDSHSAEGGISSKNVTSLQSKWTFNSGSEISVTPVIATIAGKHVAYFGSWSGVFYAVDAVSGTQLWTFTVDYVGGKCVSTPTTYCRIGSTAAVDVANNLVFFGCYNGYLYAVNATTGKLVWKVLTGDSIVDGYEVWASPAVYNGMVLIGTSSHGDRPCVENAAVNAYNEQTGQTVWSLPTLDQNTCPGGGGCTGSSVWSSLAVDDVNGIVFAGTGNPGSTCTPPTQNAGLYPDSVLAINANTGQLLNYFQAVQNDNSDLDFGASPILHSTGAVDQCTNQQSLQYWVSEPSKNGNLYTLRRNASGLTGTPQQNVAGHTGEGVIATPAALPASISKSCGPNKKLVQYVDGIFSVAVGGNFYVFQQVPGGKVTPRASQTMSDAFYGQPVTIQDISLFAGTDGTLYASDYNGKILNTIALGSPAYGGVSISNGRVYLGTKDGVIHCFSINGK